MSLMSVNCIKNFMLAKIFVQINLSASIAYLLFFFDFFSFLLFFVGSTSASATCLDIFMCGRRNYWSSQKQFFSTVIKICSLNLLHKKVFRIFFRNYSGLDLIIISYLRFINRFEQLILLRFLFKELKYSFILRGDKRKKTYRLSSKKDLIVFDA